MNYSHVNIQKLGVIGIPSGFYSSEIELAKVINNLIAKKGLQDYFTVSYDEISRKLSISFPSSDNRWYKICFSYDIARKSGFYEDEEKKSDDTITKTVPDNEKIYQVYGRGGGTHYGNYTTRLDEIDQLFVYCDLASELHQVGSDRSPLLAIVPASNGGFGVNVIFEPKTLIWLPLKRKSFNTAHVYIADAQGRKIPFTSGTSIVRVEIRRRAILL